MIEVPFLVRSHEGELLLRVGEGLNPKIGLDPAEREELGAILGWDFERCAPAVHDGDRALLLNDWISFACEMEIFVRSRCIVEGPLSPLSYGDAPVLPQPCLMFLQLLA